MWYNGGMKKILVASVCLLAAGRLLSGAFDGARLVGRTDKDPVSYKVGETIAFTLRLKGLSSLPDGSWSVGWQLTGDDGQQRRGKSPISLAQPVEVSTTLAKPGFVRLEAYLLDADGKRVLRDVPAPGENWHNVKEVFFDGGAGADVAKLRQGEPEPADFDAYWAKQKAALRKVPVKAQRTEVKSPNPKVRLYAVRVDCAGGRPVTGYMSIPVECDKGRKVHARVSFDGYGTPIQRPPESVWNIWAIDFHINAHGYELGRDEAYYRDFFAGIRSNGRDYAYDPVQNADPDTAYFHGMALRVLRALEYIESLPEWNGVKIDVEGGSQGGLQTVWAAAMNDHVTDANPGFIWCCDIGKKGEGRQKSVAEPAATPGLRYYDAVNHARRIKAKVHVPRAGLGDYLCPPSGLAVFFNNLGTKDRKITWVQGSRHDYVPPKEDDPEPEDAEVDSDRPSTAKDLITNVSLEKIQPDGSVAELGGHPGRLMIDSSGNHFVRIVQEKPGTMTSIYRKHDISGGYNRLAVSLRARVSGLVKGDENWYDARIIFNIKNAAGQVVKTDAVIFNSDTPDWVTKRQTVEVPADAATLEYMIGEPSVWDGTQYQSSFLTKAADFRDTGGQHSVTYSTDDSLENGSYYLTLFDNSFGYAMTRPDYDWSKIGLSTAQNAKDADSRSQLRKYLVDEETGTYTELVVSSAVVDTETNNTNTQELEIFHPDLLVLATKSPDAVEDVIGSGCGGKTNSVGP